MSASPRSEGNAWNRGGNGGIATSPRFSLLRYDLTDSDRGYAFPFGMNGSATYEIGGHLLLTGEAGMSSFRVSSTGISAGLRI